MDASNSALNTYIRISNNNPVAISVASGLPASLAWVIRQVGAGVGTVSLSGGTVNGPNKTAGQHTTLSVIHVGSNTVDIIGGTV